MKQLVADHPVVPQDNISEFLDRVWARLPASELYEPDEFLKIMGPIFQPATYDPKLFLDEEGSLLTLEVQNTYETVHGEFVLPGPNPDFQMCIRDRSNSYSTMPCPAPKARPNASSTSARRVEGRGCEDWRGEGETFWRKDVYKRQLPGPADGLLPAA